MLTKRLSVLSFVVLLGLTALPGRAAENTPAKPVVEIVFEKPENYSDVKDAYVGSEKGRQDILDEIRDYVVERAGRYLPVGQQLTLTFTDIDLAGDFEPWRTNGHDVRIVKDIYPPRFAFAYKLTDSSGAVVKEGREELRDMAFMSRLVIDRSDPLRFEKSMLDDWMRAVLKPARK